MIKSGAIAARMAPAAAVSFLFPVISQRKFRSKAKAAARNKLLIHRIGVSTKRPSILAFICRKAIVAVLPKSPLEA